MADSRNHDPRVDGPDTVDPHARPLLPGIFQVVTVGADKVVLRSAGRSVRFVGDGVAETLAPLLDALDGTATVHELATRFAVDPVAVERLVGRLAQEGILQPSSTGAPPAGPADPGMAPAVGATVAFVGLGPVAGVAARLLADAGVREVVVDDGAGGGGARALDAAGTASDHQAIGSVDLVVLEAPDGDRQAAEVAAWCRERRHRVLLHSAWATGGIVGPTLDPDGLPCFECLDLRRLSHAAHLDEELAYRAQSRATSSRRPHAPLPPGLAAVLGGLLSLEALRLLTGSPPPVTVGTALVADVGALSVRPEAALAVPGCATCAAPAAIHVDL